MIVVVALVARKSLTESIPAAAHHQADQGLTGSMEGQSAMSMSVRGGGDVLRRLCPLTAVPRFPHFLMKWAAILRDLLIGLFIAGAASALIPDASGRSWASPINQSIAGSSIR